MNTRLKEPTDSDFDSVFSGDFNNSVYVLSQGNPGAIVAILAMVSSSVKIDPQAWGQELHSLMELQNLGLRGASIHTFFKYTCNSDLVTVFAMFRAVQLGFIRKEELLDAVADHRPLHNCVELVAQVKARLGSFGNAD